MHTYTVTLFERFLISGASRFQKCHMIAVTQPTVQNADIPPLQSTAMVRKIRVISTPIEGDESELT